MNKPRPGQIYKYPDSDDLYLVALVDISSCVYSVLVNITTGYVNGPSVMRDKYLVLDMIKAADNINELKKGETEC